jgi:hypothetical protein
MKRSFGLVGFAIVMLVTSSQRVSTQTARGDSDHVAWVAKSLTEMQKIGTGNTREELERVFYGSGGFFARRNRTYVYRDCPYFKVDVEFDPVGPPANPVLGEGPNDKIRAISRPYLAWPVED